MIKHVVLFKLTENNPKNIEKAVTALNGMANKIEPLRQIEVGINFNRSERSYDIALITHFDNRKGLEMYSDHPVHKPVKDTISDLCSSTVVVDYETR